MGPFDTTELDRKIAEARELELLGGEAPLQEEEQEEAVEAEQGPEADEGVEQEEEVTLEAEEESPPKDSNGWKRLREKKKEAQRALDEERKMREQREQELSQLKERLARLEGRDEARVAPKVETNTDPEPDADLDPDEHLRWQVRQLRNENSEIKKKAEEAAAISKVEAEKRGLDYLEKDYVKKNKIDDYSDRLDHLQKVEANLIRVHYPNATDEQIHSHLQAERLRLAREAYARGQNPAEVFYKMSEAMNYQKQARKLSDAPNIEAINKNMKKSANLIGSSNADSVKGITSEKLVSMSMAELLSGRNEKHLDAAIKRAELADGIR